MKRVMMFILIIATLVSGAALMHTKYTVQEKARELKLLASQIHKDRKAIRVLRAEWAYKTTPYKLQNQSLEYLALMPVLPSQVLAGVDEIPFRRNPLEPVAGSVGVLLPRLGTKEKIPKISDGGKEAESLTHTAGREQAQTTSMLLKIAARQED